MSESDKYEVLEKIGHGSFGVIRKVRRKQDGQVLCRKEINYLRMSQKEREQLHAEFAILSSLRHPNIVGYYHREHLKSSQDLHLYMEYCGNGDLGRVIKDLQAKKQYAEEAFVWSMFSQLVTALYRCHYGIDPPDVGSNVMGVGLVSKIRPPTGGVTILHRDLKPENVFLGESNSVKLGDFGLSKIMQSHDFASTYVGTPFYMSPEICAAERYTLKSDIWSLGCIIYELCAREPPFNAKSHFQLVQKIKEGKIAPLPSVYSPELMAVIKDCLKVNPDRRPDTAALLDLPVVKLMRKEKEVVELGRILKTKEETTVLRLREAEERIRRLDSEKEQYRAELDASLRREWEVKAQLEINRLVQVEMERLQKLFDVEVAEKVEAEVQKRLAAQPDTNSKIQEPTASSSANHTDIPLTSISSNGEIDFPSTTDLTELSIDSPEPIKAIKKNTRTPFGRAQTMFANTPMDVEMGEPSPMCISSLSLSPRRNEGMKAPTNRNIFAAAAAMEAREPAILYDSDDDDLHLPPSPTRSKSSKNPFQQGPSRPVLHSQKTAPALKLNFPPPQQHMFQVKGNSSNNLANAPELKAQNSASGLKEKSTSPNRRLSKIPSSANIVISNDLVNPGSPTRRPSQKASSKSNALATSNPKEGDDLNKFAVKNNMAIKSSNNFAPKGRTLVELAQARAGGVRPSSADGNRSPEPKSRAFAARMAERNGSPAVWDPERDEMPSPFLVKKRAVISR